MSRGRAIPGARCALFVYGTLRRGRSHHHLMSAAEFLSEGHVHARLFQLPEYPCATLSNDSSDVLKGEVFLFADEAALAEIDRYEGIGDPGPQEYRRVLATVFLPTHARIKAWFYAYLLPTESLPRLQEFGGVPTPA